MLITTRKRPQLIQISPELETAGVQLFGNDPQIMAECAERLIMMPSHCLISIWVCPVPKVVNNGEGSALMKDPELIGRIVEAVSKAVDKTSDG